MKKSTTLIVLALAALSTNAQLTIDASNTVHSASVQEYAQTTDGGVAAPEHGSGMVYDYSGIGSTEVELQERFPAVRPEFAASTRFEIGQSYLGPVPLFSEYYTQLTPEGIVNTGSYKLPEFVNLGLFTGNPLDGLTFPGNASVFENLGYDLPFPAAYNDSWTSTNTYRTDFLLTVAAFNLNETPGYQIQRVQFSGEVVGDGTLILPTSDGPSEAINIILVQDQAITTDSIFLAGAPAPEALTNVFGISQGDVGAINRYYFYAENYELPVLQLNMGSNWNTSVGTIHASEELINSILEVQNETNISEVFPNPIQMNEQINFKLHAQEGQYTIQFFDQLGKEVHSIIAMNENGSLNYQLPREMAAGMYIYRVSNSNGVILKKGNLVVKG
ncbi:MAG: T9SS type A sorting domain-containing protein [Flavobacteriales bacterium]|nr:T9SS type A sorting domain-containing protein [Flavobacteriales bacterium]